jgi:hypothetical protein
MKIKNYYLIATLIILFVSNHICFAQENADTAPSREIVAKSTYLPFKTVKDRFGKKFAQSYFVIQVDIRNEMLDKQFIVQTLDVVFDRGQCRFAPPNNDQRKDCEEIFDQYFFFTNSKQPVTGDDVFATGEADLNRSNRNVGFRVLAFTASIGSILTGFNGLIGRDGVKGINVLGTTATAAAAGLFPDSADRKLENLRNAVPTEDVIIKSKESRTFNIFIPTERVFWKDSWKEYVKPARDSESSAYKLKIILETIMLSSATGVLVDNNAETVEVRSDDSVRRQAEKIRQANYTDEEISNIDTFSATMLLLQRGLENSATTTTTSLRNILAELMKVQGIKAVLDKRETKVTAESNGTTILQAIKELMRELNDVENGAALKQKVRDIVITNGR